jgi:hypothetical protein
VPLRSGSLSTAARTWRSNSAWRRPRGCRSASTTRVGLHSLPGGGTLLTWTHTGCHQLNFKMSCKVPTLRAGGRGMPNADMLVVQSRDDGGGCTAVDSAPMTHAYLKGAWFQPSSL